MSDQASFWPPPHCCSLAHMGTTPFPPSSLSLWKDLVWKTGNDTGLIFGPLLLCLMWAVLISCEGGERKGENLLDGPICNQGCNWPPRDEIEPTLPPPHAILEKGLLYMTCTIFDPFPPLSTTFTYCLSSNLGYFLTHPHPLSVRTSYMEVPKSHLDSSLRMLCH